MMELIPGTGLLTPFAYYESQLEKVRYVRKVSGPFEEGITHGQRKRIAKCERAGMFFCRASIPECFPIIEENRARKGRKYAMTLDDWMAIWRSHPDTVRCFAVRPGPVAVAMCVRPKPGVLCVQAWGDIEGQEKFSPVTLLARGIYHYCQNKGIELMDLGIADEPGLIAFKQSLGFQPT